jgi:Rrf2 family protein
MFSRACEYGIRAVILIHRESRSGGRISLKDIAGGIDSPTAFTAKILQSLARVHVVRSVHGPKGGYEIEPKALNHITLSDIVLAIDGDEIFKGCGLGFETCHANKPCPVHDEFVAIREDLKNMMENTTIEKLARGVDEGITFLKR